MLAAVPLAASVIRPVPPLPMSRSYDALELLNVMLFRLGLAPFSKTTTVPLPAAAPKVAVSVVANEASRPGEPWFVPQLAPKALAPVPVSVPQLPLPFVAQVD